MKNNIFLSGGIILLLIFNIVLVRKNYVANKTLELSKEEIHSLSNVLNTFSSKESIQFMCNDIFLSDSMFYNQKKWKDYSVSELDHYKLVLYYSEFHCRICNESEIKKLKEFANLVGKENVILFLEYDSERDLNLFIRLHQIDLEYFRVDRDCFVLPYEKNLEPLYFLIDSRAKITNSFIPFRGIYNITDNYYSSLQKYFDFSPRSEL